MSEPERVPVRVPVKRLLTYEASRAFIRHVMEEVERELDRPDDGSPLGERLEASHARFVARLRKEQK